MRELQVPTWRDSELLRQKVQPALVWGVLNFFKTPLGGFFFFNFKFFFSVEKDANGPPTGAPINIEIQGDNYDELITTAEKYARIINTEKIIAGIESLKNRCK